jgi:hypothetical protein
VRSWFRVSAALCVLVTTAFQIAAERNAVPAPVATAPWLDGRPTTVLVTSAPEWRPGDGALLRFVCFDAGAGPHFGLLEGSSILELRDDLFAPVATTGATHRLSDVTLLSPLGPTLPGRVLRLDHSGGVPEGARLTSLEALPVVGPGAACVLGCAGQAHAEAVVGLVVGHGKRPLFGVTAGLLLSDARSVTSLVLGPAVARGLDRIGRDLTLELDAGAGRTSGRRVVTSQRMDAARRLVASAGLARGDLVLLGHPASVASGFRPSERALRCRLTAVGELRCRTVGADRSSGPSVARREGPDRIS